MRHRTWENLVRFLLLVRINDKIRDMRYKIFFTLSLLTVSLLAFSQTADLKLSISRAFEQGDISVLEKYMGSTIYLDVENSDGNFSIKQAQQMLQDFVNKHPRKSFKINHEGKSDDGAKYIIATYSSGTAAYRIYFLIDRKKDSYKILQVEIEELSD